MGAPKQKWTTEEETALKAGVLKHGAGKWRTILKDPQFSGVLYQRSNVDLKDKWRNMSVMANGWGSREKARLALKRMVPAPKGNDNTMAVTPLIRSGEEIVNDKPSAVSLDSSQTGSSKRSMRLDNLIMEAIYNMKEPGGSNKTTIGTYIEEQYWAPPNFTRLLTAKLRFLAASGKLIKTKRKYRIAPTSSLSAKRKKSSMSLLEGSQKEKDLRKDDSDESGVVVQSHFAADLDKMRVMTIEEAAAAAAKAVAEAEVAIAEAEEAAREADAAEAEAEAAKAFAEAAMEALKGKNSQRMMIRA